MVSKKYMARTATSMEIEGIKTGMVTGIGGRWRQAWRRSAMDDGCRIATGLHEGVDGDGHHRTMSMGMDEGVAERRRLRRSMRVASNRPMEHGSLPPSQLRPLPSLSLHMHIMRMAYSASACFPVPQNARHTCPT